MEETAHLDLVLAAEERLFLRDQTLDIKTAERLVVELKSKVGGGETSGPSVEGSATPSSSDVNPHRDAVSALIALGYKAADADTAVRRASLALGTKATTELLIKKSLAG